METFTMKAFSIIDNLEDAMFLPRDGNIAHE
jgi:hypothetical protein